MRNCSAECVTLLPLTGEIPFGGIENLLQDDSYFATPSTRRLFSELKYLLITTSSTLPLLVCLVSDFLNLVNMLYYTVGKKNLQKCFNFSHGKLNRKSNTQILSFLLAFCNSRNVVADKSAMKLIQKKLQRNSVKFIGKLDLKFSLAGPYSDFEFQRSIAFVIGETNCHINK